MLMIETSRAGIYDPSSCAVAKTAGRLLLERVFLVKMRAPTIHLALSLAPICLHASAMGSAMRIVLLVSALILGFTSQASAQDGTYRRPAPTIEVTTPIGGFAVREGEIGFTELVRPPYRFRPGFLY